jgi:hypothetical protein
MNKLLLLAFAAFVSLSTIAQTTITNGNMETWTDVGASKEEPANFNSIKNGSGNSTAISFAPQSCFREATIIHGGSYSAKILTGNALGQGAPGSLTTGRVMVPNLQASDGYIKTIPGDANYSMPFIGRPDTLVVWFRYVKQGSDYPSITCLLHVGNAYLPEAPVNSNHPDSSVNIIARAEWQGAAASVTTFTRLAIPFTYVDNRIPQYILITATSSANSSPTTNSTLYVDDFEVIYNPTVATGTINPLAYYVSAATGASVSVPYTLTGTFTAGNVVTAELSDANGSFTSPVNIGTATSVASGIINATIPAGTATGTGYRIRVKTNTPALTAADNTSNISITLVSNSVAPSATQNIAANVNGNLLTLTETPAATAREWKFSTVSGSGYQNFTPTQTGNTYTPNFANAGSYYIVAVSTFPGGLTVTSNETRVNVVSNSIAPTSSQSILVGVNGTLLTVTETPAASSREWMYATTSGGTYQMIMPMQMGTTYTPNFASAGSYYVICQSTISGITVNSNEVLVVVGNATLTTGSVSGSPFLFSPSAPDATVSVPFTTSGTFSNGNVFTAQLSDANGSFASPASIGTLTATSTGTINATIQRTTAAGTGYRVRVVSSNPALTGTDNGTNLTVDQFNNSIAPPNAQTIAHGANGTALAVFASQTSTEEWKYSTTSGSGYVSFVPAETGSSYTPNFATPGTYYVVAVSKNTYNDEVTSNEVQITVTNGTVITTSTVSGSPFDVSPSMNAPVSVNFTSDAVFTANNVFTAQLSDFAGSFASPVAIGTLSGATIGTISANIPGSTPGSTAYRIRVVSSDPAITGSDNGTDLTVNPFEISVAPSTQQNIAPGANGAAITVTTTQTATYEWQYSEVQGTLYGGFTPAQTGNSCIPVFNLPSTYYVVCKATNGATDVLVSQDVVIVVANGTGINETNNSTIKAYWNGNSFMVDLTQATLTAPVIELMNTTGQIVLKEKLSTATVNTVATSLNTGMYIFKITDGDKTYSGKTSKK